MRHLTHGRPNRRQPLFVTDPGTGRTYPVPQGGDEPDPDPDPDPDPNPADPDPDPDPDDGKKLTQAEVDAILAKRLADAKTKWEQDAKAAADREKMDEAERLKAEKADAETKAQQATEAANLRIVTAEAKVAAVAEGGDPKQAAYIVKLADLSDVEVNDDGEPDAAAIKKAIAKVLTDVPALKAQAGGGRSGGELGGGEAPTKVNNIADAVNKRYAQS